MSRLHSRVDKSLKCKGGNCPLRSKCARNAKSELHEKERLEPQYSRWFKRCCNFISLKRIEQEQGGGSG